MNENEARFFVAIDNATTWSEVFRIVRDRFTDGSIPIKVRPYSRQAAAAINLDLSERGLCPIHPDLIYEINRANLMDRAMATQLGAQNTLMNAAPSVSPQLQLNLDFKLRS